MKPDTEEIKSMLEDLLYDAKDAPYYTEQYYKVNRNIVIKMLEFVLDSDIDEFLEDE